MCERASWASVSPARKNTIVEDCEDVAGRVKSSVMMMFDFRSKRWFRIFESWIDEQLISQWLGLIELVNNDLPVLSKSRNEQLLAPLTTMKLLMQKVS
jgi:hypothetical protein